MKGVAFAGPGKCCVLPGGSLYDRQQPDFGIRPDLPDMCDFLFRQQAERGRERVGQSRPRCHDCNLPPFSTRATAAGVEDMPLFSGFAETRAERHGDRQGRVEIRIGRNPEQVDFGEARRIRGGQGAQPPVLAVAEAHAPVSLDEMDAIENTSPHIAGSLEGVAAPSGDQERVLAGREPGIEAVEFGLAKQAAADGGSGGQGCIEVDEGLFRRAPFRPGRGPGITGGGESRVDLLEIEMDPSPSRSIQLSAAPESGASR